jgi:TonB-dependent receptor
VSNHRLFRTTRLLLGASAAALLASGLAAGAAQAQDPAPGDVTEVDEVVVTGFRASLAQGIDIKQRETGQVDAIVAEDIADFPDLNLSESIQRIPGVAITRDAGEGRQISVRGLGPQFTRVRLNGMEALATGGGTDAAGGTNRSRSFDFNVFASELFNSIIVRKTASAEVEEGSLGATVDLQTARPFDYSGFTFAASGQGAYNDLTQETDPRAAVLISNRFFDGKLGALLSVAYSERQVLEEGASTVRWQNGGFGAETTSAYTLADLNAAFHPRIPRYDVYEDDLERLGVTASFQFRPQAGTLLNLDLLYAKFEGTRTETFLESPVFSTSGASGIGGVTVTDAEIRGDTLVYGQFNGVDIRSEMRFDSLSTEYRQATLTGSHQFNDRFTGRFIGGWAESDHQNPIQTTLLFDRNNINGYVYDYRGDNRLPLITYGAVDVTDPATWTLSQIRLRPQAAVNTYATIQGHGEWEAFDWLTIKAGVEGKRYDFESTELRRSNGTAANLEGVIPGFAAAIPIGNYGQLITIDGSGLSIPAGNQNSWLAPNLQVAANLMNLYDQSVFPLGIEPALGNNFEVTEEDLGGYIQADWQSEWFGVPVRGNVGVRQVSTRQSSTGYTFSGGVPVQSTVERSYRDFLPSANLVLEPFGDDFLIRLSAARQMSRPNLGQLSPGAAVSVSGSNRTVTAGNPYLEPFRADSYDLSLEWSFAEDSLISVAFFYKDIGTFVQTIREGRPFTGNPLGLPDSVATAACPGGVNTSSCNPGLDWQFSLPSSTPGGPVKGIEIGYQQPFRFLPGFLSHTGFTGNITWVDSEIDYLNSTGGVAATDQLTGLSDLSWNATLYYEDDRVSARVSAAYRSDYLTTIPGRNGNVSESTAETLNIDMSASYTFNDNWKVTFEGLNLTDEVNDQFLSPDDRSSFYHHYGRQFMLGFRYTY